MKNKISLQEGVVFDAYMTFYFLKKLSTPFKSWKAYSLGIIDETGKVLKKRKDLTTQEEKSAFGVLDVIILNLKKMLQKIPGGQSTISSFVAATFLIRENNFKAESEDILYEAFADHYDFILRNKHNITLEKKSLVENVEDYYDIDYLYDELLKAPVTFSEIEEDVPANSISGGGVPSLTEPIVNKDKKLLKRFKEIN